MNHLDELLTLYRGQPDVQVRRYLLSAMSRCPPASGSLPLLALLRSEVEAPELRHAARRELGRVLPRHLVREYGFDEDGATLWTGFVRRGAPERYQPVWEPAHEPAVLAAFSALWPALRQALSLFRRSSGAVRRAASLALGRTPLAAVSDALVAHAAQREVPFDDVAALAELGTAASHDALLACARTNGLQRPELVSLLAAVPGAQALPLLAQLEARTDLHGRANIALALSTDGSPAAHALLARLARRRELWVTAHALDALALQPSIADLSLLRDVAASEPDEFLRVLAVRAAGLARSTEHLAFARTAARDAAPRVRAAALEALVRLSAPPEALVEIARELGESPVVRAQVPALLVLSRLDPERAAAKVDELLFSEDALRRLEGAFVTGYAVGPESASVLAEMAARDPDPDVRYQAVQSIARQPARFAVERLALLVGSDDERVAISAARALPLVEPAALGEAAAAIAAALATARAGAVRHWLLKGAGVAARRSGAGVPAVIDRALSSADPDELHGALSGLETLLGVGVDARVERLLRHPHAGVRASAAVAAFWAGRAAAVPALEALVSTTDDTALTGLAALTRCAVVLPRALATGSLRAWSTGSATGTALVPARVDLAASGSLDAEAGHVPGAESKRVAGTATRLRARYDGPRSRRTAKEEILRDPLPVRPGPTLQRVLVLITVLGVMLLVALRRPPPVEPRPSPRALVVDFARGVPRRVNTGSSTGLGLHDEIHAGDRLVTGRDRQLSLRAEDGASLWLEPSSELTVVSDVAFAGPMGDMTFDLRPRERVTIEAPPFTLVAEQAQFRLGADQTEVGLRVLAGTVTLKRPGAAPRRLATGEKLSLTRPASR